MKVTILASLFAAASSAAIPACEIPAAYVDNTNGCVGPAAGYNVFGYCTGIGGSTTQTDLLTEGALLSATTASAFQASQAAPGTTNGNTNCAVPYPGSVWDGSAAPFDSAALNAACDDTFTIADPTMGVIAAAEGFAAATTNVKGVMITCAENFYPVNGVEGSNNCYPETGLTTPTDEVLIPAVTTPATPAAAYLSGALFVPNNADALKNVPQFTGTNALQCAGPCTLPPTICANGNIHSNVIASGNAFIGGCNIRPTSATVPYTATFTCGIAQPETFTATCTANAAPSTESTVSIPGYTGQCGAPFGGQVLYFNLNSNLDFLPALGASISMNAGEVVNYAAVTAILRLIVVAANSAQNSLRYWNNNPNQVFQTGNVYDIAVTGCDTQAGAVAQSQCTQQTLNWWRCNYHIDFTAGKCYANYVAIPCPTHELGFRCPSSSKKGLLGLLGLLAIPLIALLICCPLLICCLRRKKTEADVHFATFDPLGQPQLAGATGVPTAIAPSAFAPTPFATAPSAVPVL